MINGKKDNGKVDKMGEKFKSTTKIMIMKNLLHEERMKDRLEKELLRNFTEQTNTNLSDGRERACNNVCKI